MSALAPGQRFGAYLIEARAGEGGMGTVYRARDTSLGRPVALKVIRTGGDDGGSSHAAGDGGGPAADVIARFLRESRVGASLSHPNIVVVYEASAIGECPYLAMEWIDGLSLAHHMKKGSLSFAQRLDALEAVADALAHAHGRGVIHRDVKPTNVMIDNHPPGAGRARLVDFGIAKPTTVAASPATMMLPTHARQVLGTPAYMAPEQMLSPSVDARADQYSWAVMAYEVLAGVHPAETVAPGGSAFPVAKAKPLGWVKPEVPDAVAAVVHRAMSYEPGGRFAGMSELLFALRAARQGVPAAGVSYPPGSFGAGPTISHSQSTIGSGGVAPTLDTRSSHPNSPFPFGPTAPGFAATPSFAPSYGPAPMPAPKKLPVIALVAVLASLFVGGGIAVAAVVLTQTSGVAGGTPGSSPISLPTPISLGPKKAFIESGMDDLKFAPGGDSTKTKTELETKLSPCYGASVSKDKSFRATIHVANDGKVTKVEELNICQEQHPAFYICTERADLKNPKRGFPVAPDAVFACMEQALLSTRFPKLVPDGEPTQDADLHIELR